MYNESQYIVKKIKYSTISKEKIVFLKNVFKNISAENENYNQFIQYLYFQKTDTKYSVIQNAASQLQLEINYQNDTTNYILDWNLKWTDSSLGSQFVKKMTKNQRINYIIGITSIARKNLLMKNLYTMRKYFPDQYDFFPETFLFPVHSKNILKYQKEKVNQNQKITFIVKPQASCQGRGIYLCQNLTEIDSQSKSIVQQYISKPMLFEGLKFDFRVYVLLKSVSPLQIYLYKQGLVRLATQKYEQPQKSNLCNLCLHLTNYAINKLNPKYQFNQTVSNLKFGHKKSLAQFFKSLTQMGCNSYRIWRQIKQCINKTLISVQPHLHSEYRKAQPKNQGQSLCYQILGFDFMMNSDQKVYLLEVNQSPSFSTETPLDFLVKNYLIKDTLKIVMYDKERRKVNLQFRSKRAKTESYQKINQTISQKNKIYCYEQLPGSILGNYQQIFPSPDVSTQKQYQKMLFCIKADYHKTFMDENFRLMYGNNLEQIGVISPQLNIKVHKQSLINLNSLYKKDILSDKQQKFKTISNRDLSPKIKVNENRRRILSLRKQVFSSKSLNINFKDSATLESLFIIQAKKNKQQKKQNKAFETLPVLSQPQEKQLTKKNIRNLHVTNVNTSMDSLNYLSQNDITINGSKNSKQLNKISPIQINSSEFQILQGLNRNQKLDSNRNTNKHLSKLSWYENKGQFFKRQNIRSHLKKYIQFLNPIEKAARQRIQKQDYPENNQKSNQNQYIS